MEIESSNPGKQDELTRLNREGLLTKKTFEILDSRRASSYERGDHLFSESQFETLVALCEILRPLHPGPDAREIAVYLESRLASGKGDGWRYDAMPPDAVAYAQGLVGLEGDSIKNLGVSFCKLEPGRGEELIRILQTLEVGGESWAGIGPRIFMEEILAEIAYFVYSRPSVQEDIGYVGYADAKGWRHVGLNEREKWGG